MDARDPIRVKLTEQLLEKLYNMGVIPGKTSLSLCDKLSTSSFCRCAALQSGHLAYLSGVWQFATCCCCSQE